jgi:hypothetical protein
MLFQSRVVTGTRGSDQYAVSADGRRFLLLNPLEDAKPSAITAVLNWTAALSK